MISLGWCLPNIVPVYPSHEDNDPRLYPALL
jgi:hypothetical protein